MIYDVDVEDYKRGKHANRLLLGLFSQFENQLNCDITFKLGETELKAHKCILSIFTNLLVDMKPFLQENGSVLVLDEILESATKYTSKEISEDLKKLVQYLYTGNIDLNSVQLDSFSRMAMTFQCDLLMREINKYESLKSEEKNNLKINPVTDEVKTDVVEDKCNIPKRLIETDWGRPKDILENVEFNEKKEGSSKATKNKFNTILDLVSVKNKKKSSKSVEDCKLNLASPSSQKRFPCPSCSLSFIHVKQWLRHVDQVGHLPETKGDCVICGLSLASREEMVAHLTNHRTPGKPYWCRTCGAKFCSGQKLGHHQLKHSDKEGDWGCEVCGKRFKWKQVLKVHMATHSHTAPHLCPECGFSSRHRSTMATHMNKHAGQTFPCPKPDCLFTTPRAQNLTTHLSTVHRTRDEKANLKCSECDKTFTQKKNLTRHRLVHQSDRQPRACKSIGCSFTTFRPDKMSDHLITHHSEDSVSDHLTTHHTADHKMPHPITHNSDDKMSDNLTSHHSDHNVSDSLITNLSDDKMSDRLASHHSDPLPPSSLALQGAIFPDTMRFVNPPNTTVTQSLATMSNQTKPLNSLSNPLDTALLNFINQI